MAGVESQGIRSVRALTDDPARHVVHQPTSRNAQAQCVTLQHNSYRSSMRHSRSDCLPQEIATMHVVNRVQLLSCHLTAEAEMQFSAAEGPAD